MNLTLNYMEEKDIPGVLKVSTLSLKESWSIDSFTKELSNPLAKYIVAKFDDTVVGFAGVWTILDEGHITNIAVHPNYRKQKIGSKLVKSLLDYCHSCNCNALTLEVRESNLPAQGLYKKYGFKEEGIRKNYYSDNKENAIIMWKR